MSSLAQLLRGAVLKDNFENYVKGENFSSLFTDFLGDGIFNSDGANWRMHRKIASHMFTKRLLVQGTEVASERAGQLVKRLEGIAKNGQFCDLQDFYFRCVKPNHTSCRM